MRYRVSVRAIAWHDGKLLCEQLKPYNEISQTLDPFWCVPGGGLEFGESLEAGVQRELMEETGIKAEIGNLLYIQQFPFKDKEYLEFFFHIKNPKDFLRIDLAKTSHGGAEIAKIAFIDPAGVNILPKFLATEGIAGQIAGNLPPKLFSYL
jgi:ADP-ribose pyrophosphatase YjhB (NUDIX family)